MKKIYLSGEKNSQIKLKNLQGDVTIEDLTNSYLSEAGFDDAMKSQTQVYVDDGEEPLELKKIAVDLPLNSGSEIICHRCNTVKVTVTYIGSETKLKFRPNAKVRRVLQRAGRAFDIPETELRMMELRHDGQVLLLKDRIGTYVSFPDCELDLVLSPKNRNQG